MNTTIEIECNIHRLSPPEIGYEASTRRLKGPRGYYEASGATKAEALNELVHKIGVPMSALAVVFRA